MWDAEKEDWYFSVVDVVAVLTESKDPTAYWRKLKQRLREEGNESTRWKDACYRLSEYRTAIQKPPF